MRIRFILALCVFSAAAQASTSHRVGNELLTAGVVPRELSNCSAGRPTNPVAAALAALPPIAAHVGVAVYLPGRRTRLVSSNGNTSATIESSR